MSVNFVSESTIEEARKKRQEEWERVRKPEDPLEAPEQPYDSRTLYERLQEQKNKKQEEYEESRKLKNYVKGLEDDEVEFLHNISEQKAIIESEKYEEEMSTLEEFKKTKTTNITAEQDQLISEAKREVLGGVFSDKPTLKPPSQASKLSMLVKRKAPSASSSSSNNNDNNNDLKVQDITSDENSPKKPKIEQTNSSPVNVLSSLLGYGSSDSDSDS